MAIRISKEPLVEPFSLTEAKLHLRVDGTDDDALITQLIKVARTFCELFQGRAYIVRTYERTYDDTFPSIMYLANPPLCYVDSITYLDQDGESQTVTSSLYTVDTKSEPGLVYEAYNQMWPSSVRWVRNMVTVNYVAGYAAEFTVDTETDILTVLGRTYTVGDKVRLYNSGGTLPAGLSANLDYYVIEVSDNTFQLSLTSGGDAVEVTADEDGGTHYIGEVPETIKVAMKLIINHLYENRENSMDANLIEIPMGAKSFLMQDRVQW